MAFATTDQEYYENSEHWGERQFITLENIIDNILLGANDDSYFKNFKKHHLRIIAKQGIKKLEINVGTQSKAISITVPSCKIFPFPRYMKDWSIISVINKCGKLQELKINNSPIINDYLQDNNYQLLYDLEGNILEGNSFNAEKGDCCIKRQCKKINDSDCYDERFDNSWVKHNKKSGYFEFSDDLIDNDVVIEYTQSSLDNIEDCDIKIDDRLEMALDNYIRYNLLRGQRNVPSSKWREYYETFKIEKRNAKFLLSNKVSLVQILSAISKRY